MTRTLMVLEAAVLLPLAILHVLAVRLDRLLFPSPVAVAVVMPCRAPSPAAGLQRPPLASLSTVALRKLAQQQGLRSVGGIRSSKARRGDLLQALA